MRLGVGMSQADDVANRVIGAALSVHKKYGPGLLESVYTACVGQELLEQGLDVAIEQSVPLQHRSLHIKRAFVIDLRVEDCVIVEVKSVASINEIHVAQVLTYLRLTGLRLGLIINFNVTVLKNGIRRVVNNHVDEAGNRL